MICTLKSEGKRHTPTKSLNVNEHGYFISSVKAVTVVLYIVSSFEESNNMVESKSDAFISVWFGSCHHICRILVLCNKRSTVMW
jgi:hypothetical protein